MTINPIFRSPTRNKQVKAAQEKKPAPSTKTGVPQPVRKTAKK